MVVVVVVMVVAEEVTYQRAQEHGASVWPHVLSTVSQEDIDR